jgi:precorrin-6B methylase 2
MNNKQYNIILTMLFFLLIYYIMKNYILTNGQSNAPKNNITKLTNDQFEKIYATDDSRDVYRVDKNNLEKGVYATYGEIKFDSIEDLIKEANITKDDIFYDLGSGSGKVVMQVYTNTSLNKAVGIEYFKKRHMMSEHALKKLYNFYPNNLENNKILTYYQGNILNFDITDATVIFMCSTCFNTDLMDGIFEKIKQCPNIRMVISLKEYDNYKEILPNKKEIKIKCSWAQSVSCRIYSK